MEMKYFNPWISHTGVITWVPEIRIHTKCIIKIGDFPFDTQWYFFNKHFNPINERLLNRKHLSIKHHKKK